MSLDLPQCELKKTKQIYAMKVIKKELVMDEEVCVCVCARCEHFAIFTDIL